MSNPTDKLVRYDPVARRRLLEPANGYWEGEMRQRDHGDWVKLSDVEAMQSTDTDKDARIAELEYENVGLEAAVSSLSLDNSFLRQQGE